MFNTTNLKALSSIESSPKWTISSKTPNTDKINNNPGPGQYQIESQLNNKYTSFRKSKRFNDEMTKNFVPGPGTYNPIKNLNSPQWSIAHRFKEQKPISSPFYYSYNYEKFSTAPSFHFGKAPRSSVSPKSNTPGLGDYDVKIPSSSPKYSMGIKWKDHTKSEATPGPGSYDIKNEEGMKFTMGSKTNQVQLQSNTPGPGNYEVNPIFPSGVKYTMSRKNENYHSDKNLNTPGPGTYNLEQKNYFPTYSFGIKINYKNKGNDCKTDFYETPNILGQAPKWSFGLPTTNKQISINNAPGPGSYDPMQFNYQGPKFSFPKASKLQIEKKLQYNGSPNFENFDANIFSPKWKFGSEERFGPKSSINNVPGPGSYNQKVDEHGPKWTMNGKWKQQNNVSTIHNQGIMISSFI